MNILVTGGAGYIGSHVVKDLLQEGHHVIVFDNCSTGNFDLLVPGIIHKNDFINGELNNFEDLKSLFSNFSFDAVFHFAAKASVPESIENPMLYYFNNVAGTINLLQSMQLFGVKIFIFSSTAAVYGKPEIFPIREGHPCHPINPYGQSKRSIEKTLHDLRNFIRFCSLRYFNAAGADSKGMIGELHLEEHHLIPCILKEVLRAQKKGIKPKAKVFGNQYNTPDGTCIRDYTHVSDLSQAHLLCLNHLYRGGTSKIYNLGTSRGSSVLEVIQTISEITQTEIEVEYCPARPGDPPRLVADSNLIKKELDWKPQFSQLSEIISTAWNWEKKINPAI